MIQERKTLFTLACLVAFSLTMLVGCSGSSSSPTSPDNPMPVQVADRSYSLVNSERRQHDVSPQLELEALLSQVARAHSQSMRDNGYFGHVNHQGQALRDRLRAAGVSFSSAGENLAMVENPVDPAGMAHDSLMGSSTHRNNILNDRFAVIGLGVVQRGDAYWITQIFVRP